MKSFYPPISDRETDQLIEMAHCKNRDVWQLEATNQARMELKRRRISLEYQEEVLNAKWRADDRIERWERRTQEMNKKISYPKWEMIVIFLFGPLMFFRPHIFNNHTLFSLYEDKFYLKLKQRILLLLVSFLSWLLFIHFAL